jgi:caffeoyl-CoA O-methyltransferase
MDPIIAKPLEDYAAAHTSAPSALLGELADYTRTHCDNAQMLIGPLEGGVLRLLAKLIAARRVLEIGLFTGYSALTLAEALPADGRVVTCDINPDTTRIAREFFARSPHGHKIDVRLGPAMETLATLEGPFDLVFLDADKESYTDYYEAVLPKLRPGGLLVADNVLWSGRVLEPKNKSDRVLAAFNRRVQEDSRLENALLTVRDGLMVARKI